MVSVSPGLSFFFWQEIAGVPNWLLNNGFSETCLLHCLNWQ